MKKVFFPLAFVVTLMGAGLSSCDQIVDIIEDLLTEGDATDALKEALRVGSDTAVFQGSQLDGYFGNQLIKILMPQEADPIINAINFIPGGNLLVDEVILKLNRAAEDAAPQASGILLQAITDITIIDAINIVNGPNDAATQYLKAATQDTINMLFRPHIENSLQAVGAQSAWGELTSAYNSLPLVTPVNTDLAGYTTDRASTGLFKLVAIEEGKIRNDPIHRVTEILDQVFGDGN